jgi:hypothetical protein
MKGGSTQKQARKISKIRRLTRRTKGKVGAILSSHTGKTYSRNRIFDSHLKSCHARIFPAEFDCISYETPTGYHGFSGIGVMECALEFILKTGARCVDEPILLNVSGAEGLCAGFSPIAC